MRTVAPGHEMVAPARRAVPLWLRHTEKYAVRW